MGKDRQCQPLLRRDAESEQGAGHARFVNTNIAWCEMEDLGSYGEGGDRNCLGEGQLYAYGFSGHQHHPSLQDPAWDGPKGRKSDL